MAFSNPLLILGVLLTAVPIVLHLAMRQKPKRLEFPAIRFVTAKLETNRRRLRLRHWILLALRCLAVGLAALALARPSVASAQAARWLVAAMLGAAAAGLGLLSAQSASGSKGPWLTRGLGAAAALAAIAALTTAATAVAGSDVLIGDEEAPVAAVIVVDSSPRMNYRHANRTRLEHAGELAQRLLRQLPAESQVAVIDSRREGAFFLPDRAAARNALQRLDIVGAPQPLPVLLQDALQLSSASSLARREIYVLTDLAQSAWQASGSDLLAGELEQAERTMVYVMDAGIGRPQNLALGDLQLSAQTLPRNGRLQVRTALQSLAMDGEFAVRIELEQLDPNLPIIQDGKIKLPQAAARGRQRLTIAAGGAQSLEFELPIAEPGLRHGRVVLETTDSLEIDNVRHFAVEVRRAWPVLLVSGPNASAAFMVDALAPAEFEDFACQQVSQNAFATEDLSRYAAVCLLDPAPLSDGLWQRLQEFAEAGGAVWIQLGRNARGDASFNGQAAQLLLPAPLVRQWRASERELFLTLQDASHPALRLFREQSENVPWQELPVFKHWVLGPLTPESRVLAGFSANAHPALVERPVGAGLVVTSTSPFSDVTYSERSWNELSYGENNWPSFVLANELLLYLVRGTEQPLNYATGESVELSNDERLMPRRYQLFLPNEPPQDVTSRDNRLRIPETIAAGAYRLKGNRGGLVLRGFAANLPAAATQLQRLSKTELDELLGSDRYQLASDIDQLQRVQDQQRVGRSFFPFLLLAIAGVLALEHVLANRFYKKDTAGTRTNRPVFRQGAA